MADRIKTAMAGEKKSSKKPAKSGGKKPDEIHVRRSHNKKGGYLMKHKFENSPEQMPKKDEDYHANDLDELQAHMAEHMGPQEPESEAPAAGGGGSPSPGEV